MHSIRLAYENLSRRKQAVMFALVWISVSTMFTVITASAADSARQMTNRQIENIPSIKQIDVYANTSVNVLDEGTAETFKNLGGIQTVVLIDQLGGELLFQGYQQNVSFWGLLGIEDLAELGYQAQTGAAELGLGRAIIGSEVPNNFYIKNYKVATQELLGQQIRLTLTKNQENSLLKKKFSFLVSGILQPTGSYEIDNSIFIPASETERMKKWLQGGSFNRKTDGYDTLIVVAEALNHVPQLDEQIKGLGYWSDARLQEVQKLKQVTELLESFALILAVISLVSSVIGIFITMMNMIANRKAEIGLMKAVGATDGLILKVFAGEAGLIGAFGGMAGILISVCFVWVSNHVIRPALPPDLVALAGFDLNIAIPVWLIFACPGFTLLASLLAGYLPARYAAQVDPIDALRSTE